MIEHIPETTQMEREVRAMNIEVGRRVRARRKFHKMTQEELGQRAGVSGATVQRIEKAQTSINLSVLKKLAFVLHVTLDRLLEDIA
jgi:transcriptional regulator with XRE-family HTH domain